MTCDEARPALDALVDGELAREEERVLRAHLGACAGCSRELAERRDFSGAVRSAFERELETADPAPGVREQLAERLAAASRRRVAVPARLAAALVIGLAIGLGAWAVGLSRPTKLQAELAGRLRDRELHQGELAALTREIRQDLEQTLRTSPASDPQNPPSLVIRQGVAVIESRMAEPADKGLAQLVADTGSRDPAVRSAARSALKRLEPARAEDLRHAAQEAATGDRTFVQQVVDELEDRAQPVERGKVSITKVVNGAAVAFSQMGDGRVRLTVPGRTIEVRGMSELLKQHADVCREYGITGRDGFVTIDGTPAAVDLRGQLELVFRTGGWTDDVQWDAYRAWMAGRLPDAKQVESHVKELQERCRRQYAALPGVRVEARVDVERIMKDVQAMTRSQLEETQRRIDQEMKSMDTRLEELRELRTRARGLRVYAEGVTRE